MSKSDDKLVEVTMMQGTCQRMCGYRPILAKDTYDTHDNGDRTYRVRVSEASVTVTKLEYSEDKGDFETDKKYLFNPLRTFVGKSPKNHTTLFSGGYGSEFDGNSVLLHISDNTYVFVGWPDMHSFSALSTITDFVSPVGNNDVPYPYAIDDRGNIYLFVENIILLNNEKIDNLIQAAKTFSIYSSKDYNNKELLKMQDGDPYDYYYHSHNTSLSEITGHGEMILGKKYTIFHSTLCPESEYDRLCARIPEKYKHLGMRLVKDKQKVTLTKDEYVKIQKEHAKKHDLMHFIDVKCIE